jgi:outer membrane protein TolC
MSANTGSVPSGPATNEVLSLTISEAITQAVRYNLGAIESEENTRVARGQRLVALSHLLPQVSAGINENVDQVNFTALGLGAVKIPGIPAVAGPFSYSTASASLSQTLFSYESIQRFRSARTSEQAAQLSYKDTLDVITLALVQIGKVVAVRH